MESNGATRFCTTEISGANLSSQDCPEMGPGSDITFGSWHCLPFPTYTPTIQPTTHLPLTHAHQSPVLVEFSQHNSPLLVPAVVQRPAQLLSLECFPSSPPHLSSFPFISSLGVAKLLYRMFVTSLDWSKGLAPD